MNEAEKGCFYCNNLRAKMIYTKNHAEIAARPACLLNGKIIKLWWNAKFPGWCPKGKQVKK